MRRIIFLVWLTVLWVVLWRDLSLANLVSGATVAVVVTTLYPLPPAEEQHVVRPLRLLIFFGHFAWELLVSNVVVARTVLAPRNRIHTGIVAVPMAACSHLVTTLVANAVTLTPGAMTIEVSDDDLPTLYIHVLSMDDVESVRRSILKTSRLALQALASDEAVARFDQHVAEHVAESEPGASARPDPSKGAL